MIPANGWSCGSFEVQGGNTRGEAPLQHPPLAPSEQGNAHAQAIPHPPKYRRHKSTNQAIIHFAGQRHYLGPYGSERSYRRYQELLSEWQSQRQLEQSDLPAISAEEKLLEAITAGSLRQKFHQGLAVSIYELIVVYERHSKQYYRKNGKVTREAELIGEVLDPLGKKHGRDKVSDFGPVDLDDFRDDLITERDWSRKHINKQINRAIAMFKWGAKKEICSASVHLALESLGGLKKGRTNAHETKGVRCIDDKIVNKTLPKLPEVVADMVRFHRLTGARPGEVCSIRPADIDRTEEIWLYSPDEHKTEHFEKDRVIPIGPQAQEVLLPYLVRPAESHCFSPRESIERRRRRQELNRKTPLSCGNRRGTNRVENPRWREGSRYKVASYRLAVRRACLKANVLVWTPNQLRHTAATKIRQRFGLEAAQVVCGHQSAEVTQVYAERDLELAKRVAKAVG